MVFYKCFDMFTSSVSITLLRQIWSVLWGSFCNSRFLEIPSCDVLAKDQTYKWSSTSSASCKALVSENLLSLACFTCSLEDQYLDRMLIGQDLNSGPLPCWIPWCYRLLKFERNCLCGWLVLSPSSYFGVPKVITEFAANGHLKFEYIPCNTFDFIEHITQGTR